MMQSQLWLDAYVLDLSIAVCFFVMLTWPLKLHLYPSLLQVEWPKFFNV